MSPQWKVTNFTYRSGMLLGELDGEDIPVRNYVSGNEYVGLTSGTGRESEEQYYVTDEQGSIRYVLNDNGEIESCYQYDAFGESLIQEGYGSRLQYNSQIWDELSGLYYLRARYYNPVTGRFTQEDVIYDDGLNLYAYCNSNPVIYCDPSGLIKKTCKSKCDPSRVGTGYTDGGMKRASKEWRELYGPASSREHHLIPQAMLKDKDFIKQMEKLGIADAKAYIDRQIAIISNGSHVDLHSAGWNNDWKLWFQDNRHFTLKDIQSNISNMMKEYGIPKSSRNFAKSYGKNK